MDFLELNSMKTEMENVCGFFLDALHSRLEVAEELVDFKVERRR